VILDIGCSKAGSITTIVDCWPTVMRRALQLQNLFLRGECNASGGDWPAAAKIFGTRNPGGDRAADDPHSGHREFAPLTKWGKIAIVTKPTGAVVGWH
jgi:hypothetical protein